MNYDDIRPYNDSEVSAALCRVAKKSATWLISKYLWPFRPFWTLSVKMKKVKTVDGFQRDVIYDVVEAIIKKTTDGVSSDMSRAGQEKFLAISNHRDIVLDPAFIQKALVDAGISTTRICTGNNLLANQLITDLMKSNKMILVNRDLKARELLESSQKLSSYIRESIISDVSSVWIAQRGGRSKTGEDLTEASVLKMLDMSGQGTFSDNFAELNIVPIAISYEYESCDALKAREVLLRRQGPYTKSKGEDTHSILTGIKQKKGLVHIQTAEPISREELEALSGLPRQERYSKLAGLIDSRIINSYRLFKTNYIGYDLMNGTQEYLNKEYTLKDLKSFIRYTESKLRPFSKEVDPVELKQLFFEIYGNPVKLKNNPLVTQFILC